MIHEPDVIAGHLAASPWFPIPATNAATAVRDSVAHIEADGTTVTICVTDADGARREYQATVVLVADSRTAPGVQVFEHLAGTAHTHKSATESRQTP